MEEPRKTKRKAKPRPGRWKNPTKGMKQSPENRGKSSQLKPIPAIIMEAIPGKFKDASVDDMISKVEATGVFITEESASYMRALTEGKTPKEAAQASGMITPMKSHNLRACLLAAMTAAGVDDTRLAQCMQGGIDATKTISAVSMGDANEKTVDFVDVPDWPSRLKALDIILKVRGDYAPNRQEVTGPDGEQLRSERININVNTDFEGLRALIASRTARRLKG